MKSLASFISKTLNPLVFAFLSVLLVVSETVLPIEQKALWLIAAGFAVTIPFLFLYYQYKKGRVKEFWSPDIRERSVSVFIWLSSASLFSATAFYFRAPRELLALGIVFLVLSIINIFFGNYMKLSVHSEAITVFVLAAMLTVSVLYIFLVILIPIVTWARVYLKAHNVSEVSFGSLAAVLAVYFVFNYFGLITF